MQLDELKKGMSTLEQVLAKTDTEITINVSVSETAQTKILKKYRQNIISCAIIAIVFGCLWVGNVSTEKLPGFYKAFISIITAVASVWYIFLYYLLKKIDIASCSPAILFKKTSSFKILNLTGEIIIGVGIVVLFTLYIQHLWLNNYAAFWATLVTLSIGMVIGSVYFLPKYIKLFRDLDSIKE
ncbi:hypothetical protein [uncultured Muribaculum sp.]|uniref:hypothetical protein n=1 Tax=uncultured Muribaculum sp. TaxID=1918613 RepID=UPI0025AFED30|nr:hypothetical protein [uncultured Muribaculum sp.]